LDVRVATGKPKRMSRVTAWDYKRTLAGVIKAVGPGVTVVELSPERFEPYVRTLDPAHLSTFARAVAYLEAYLRWGLMQGQFAHNEALLRARAAGIVMDPVRVILGAAMVKPPQEDLRDERSPRCASVPVLEGRTHSFQAGPGRLMRRGSWP
jgi:hypothetical protein